MMWYPYPAEMGQSGIPNASQTRLDLTSLVLCLNKLAHAITPLPLVSISGTLIR